MHDRDISIPLNVGDFDIDSFDEANVPVDIWITDASTWNDSDDDREEELVAEGYKWQLAIGVYNPQCATVVGHCCVYVCRDREPLAKLVLDHIIPLYTTAIRTLFDVVAGNKGANALYYWAETPMTKSDDHVIDA